MAPVIEMTRITAEQMTAFERYACLEISLEDLRDVLHGLFQYSLEPDNQWITHRFRLPAQGIAITRRHIHDGINKNRMGQVSNLDLANWARIILMSDIYIFDPADEDFVGDRLVDISYGEIHT